VEALFILVMKKSHHLEVGEVKVEMSLWLV
jgi:hypothetical protein